MILARGRVLDVDGDRARVVREAAEACDRCAAGQGCGGGVFARLAGRRRYVVLARLTVAGIGPGDEVILGLPETGLLAGAFAVYAVPLGGLLFAASLAALAFDVRSDLGILAAAAAGLTAGFLHLARFSRRAAGDRRFQPCVVGREARRRTA